MAISKLWARTENITSALAACPAPANAALRRFAAMTVNIGQKPTLLGAAFASFGEAGVEALEPISSRNLLVMG
jgi:hypothetical protein